MSTPAEVAVPKEHEGTREISLAQAVNEALAEELRRDPTVFLIGEDVAEAGTPFKVTSGLVEEFGPERVLDSPISEAGISFPSLARGTRPYSRVGDSLSRASNRAATRKETTVRTSSPTTPMMAIGRPRASTAIGTAT